MKKARRLPALGVGHEADPDVVADRAVHGSQRIAMNSFAPSPHEYPEDLKGTEAEIGVSSAGRTPSVRGKRCGTLGPPESRQAERFQLNGGAGNSSVSLQPSSGDEGRREQRAGKNQGPVITAKPSLREMDHGLSSLVAGFRVATRALTSLMPQS